MTTLQLISSGGYYGAENMLVNLARALESLGCHSIVGVFQDSRHSHTEVVDNAARLGIDVEVVPCAGRLDWGAIGRLRRLSKRHRPDVLHAHGYKADIYGYLASWPGSTALVSTCHNWPDPTFIMQTYAALDRIILRKFDRVAAASDGVADILRASGIDDVKYISNGVDVERFSCPALGLRSEIAGRNFDRVVGFVGRLVPEKGGALLIEAAERVVSVWPRTLFVFVGEGPARGEWEQCAREHGVAGNVLFLGRRTDMRSVYSCFDILVLPSYVEALPVCLLEAMAASVPVVATRVGCVPKVILPGISGILIEPGDATALCKAVCCLLEDPRLAQTLAYQGRTRVAQHFSAEAMARAYLGLYNQALTRRIQRRRGLVLQQ